jgi:HK97 family phage major capsid protein
MKFEDLQAMIKEAVGAAVAELREANAAKGREMQGDGALADAKPERKHMQYVLGAGDAQRRGADALAEKHPHEMTNTEKATMFGRTVRYLAAAKGNAMAAVALAEERGDKVLAEYWGKALGVSTLAGGGALVAPEFVEGIIEELGAKSTVLQFGVTRLPMPTGGLDLPYIDTSATAAYGAESTNITKSEPTFGQLELREKELRSLVPLSNRLLNYGGARVDRFIKDHMVRVMKRKLDVTLIRSDGTASAPKGMLYWTQAANKFNANGTVNLANVTDDLGQAIYLLEKADVEMDGAGWIISPRSKKYLSTVRTTDGWYAFRDEMKAGTIMGYPWKMTSQVPDNLGSGTNESEVYLAAFPYYIFAESEMMELAVFDGGAYHDGSAVQSGISRNESVIRTLANHDFGAQQRGQESVVIEDVKWGA